MLPIIALESSLAIYDNRVRALLEASPFPFYNYSLYASDGQRKLGRGEGPLKLVLDPFILYRNLPNQSQPWFKINSRGYRGGEVDLRPSIRRVVLVGGSAAFGTGAPSDQDTFGARLERRFENVQIVNAAIIGSVSGDALTLVQRELLDLHPSLIMEFDGINDAGGCMMRNQGILQKVSFCDLEEGLVELQRIRTSPAAGLLLLSRSLFPHLGRRLTGWWRRERFLMPEEDLEARVRLYTENVRSIAEAAARRKVPFVVLLQPERPDRYLGAGYSAHENAVMSHNYRVYTRFVTLAVRMLQGQNIPLLNVHELASLRAEHFTDDIHLTPDGSELVAEAAFQYIQQRGLLDAAVHSPASSELSRAVTR
jgi:lysophospholipase L1-like esterase